MRLLTLILLMAILASACNSKQNNNSTTPQKEDTPSYTLVVNVDGLRLRDTPGENGKSIETLKEGETLADLGEVSDFTTPIVLRNHQYDEPWLKVMTRSGKTGWVYGGAIRFDDRNPSGELAKLQEKRFAMFFGPDLLAELHTYRLKYKLTDNSARFAMLYREGDSLRGKLVKKLEEKITLSADGAMPDLFWLENMVPGYVPQLVAEGTMYHLFRDFRKLNALAAITHGTEDDDFIRLMIQDASVDSVEYFIGSWDMMIADAEYVSLLGQGIHRRLLNAMAQLSSKTHLFDPEINDLKRRLLEDITASEVRYWEPADKIRDELNKIIKDKIPILTKEDNIALETRARQFNLVKENKIIVNLRSGTE